MRQTRMMCEKREAYHDNSQENIWPLCFAIYLGMVFFLHLNPIQFALESIECSCDIHNSSFRFAEDGRNKKIVTDLTLFCNSAEHALQKGCQDQIYTLCDTQHTIDSFSINENLYSSFEWNECNAKIQQSNGYRMAHRRHIFIGYFY